MNLDAYLQRIGYDKSTAPTLDTLRGIAYHHALAIPFENLNPFLGLPVSLAPDDVEHKLVTQGRGGYCFEHNRLLAEALHAMGFEVSGLAARVLWTRPEDAVTMRSHQLLRVELDGRTHLVDVGFGGLTLTGALELLADAEQATPHEPFRLLDTGGDWRMQANIRGTWTTLYRFDMQRQYPIDYEVSNYYLSTHPASHFVTHLIAARPTPEGRLALSNRDLAFHRKNGETERRTLESPAALCAVLATEFGLDLSGLPQLAARLDTLF